MKKISKGYYEMKNLLFTALLLISLGFTIPAFSCDSIFLEMSDSVCKKMEITVPDYRINWKGQIDFLLATPGGKQFKETKFTSKEEAAAAFKIMVLNQNLN